MLKRLLTMFLALTLLIPFVTPLSTATANPGGSGGQEERIVQIRAPYWDVWKHNDGTWQYTGRPGGSYTQTITLDVPEKFKQGYKNIRVEIKQGPPTKVDNDDPNIDPKYKRNWDIYQRDILERSANITSYSISGHTATLSFTLPTPPEEKAVNIKDEEEAKGQQFLENVEGWRYYLPFVVYWYGTPDKPAELPDLYVKSLTSNTSTTTQGTRYSGTVTFGLKNDYPQPMQAKLTLTHNGYSVSGVDGQRITLNPGEEKTFNFNFTGQNGNSFLYAKIAPATGDDKDWSNNTATLDIPQKERPEPKASAKLTLQAKSQSGKYTRKPGEAKWTDWVTATLKPDPPTPPRGKLDWWKITKAELYHPKKHPEFTFGTPYQPQGHVVRQMQVKENGHVAEVVFQQDWSMDGTPIYSQIEKKMMTTEKPRAYPIQVNYTIEYQYSYTVCGLTGCYTVTKTATLNGKETADLLVTGTGVDSKAN